MSPFEPRRATTPVFNPETEKTSGPGQFVRHEPGAPAAAVAQRLVRETDDQRYERMNAEREAASKAEHEANIKDVRSMVVARTSAGGAYTDEELVQLTRAQDPMFKRCVGQAAVSMFARTLTAQHPDGVYVRFTTASHDDGRRNANIRVLTVLNADLQPIATIKRSVGFDDTLDEQLNVVFPERMTYTADMEFDDLKLSVHPEVAHFDDGGHPGLLNLGRAAGYAPAPARARVQDAPVKPAGFLRRLLNG